MIYYSSKQVFPFLQATHYKETHRNELKSIEIKLLNICPRSPLVSTLGMGVY